MFTCVAHPLRKRPTTCPDCARELAQKQNKPAEEVIKVDTVNVTSSDIEQATEQISKPELIIKESISNAPIRKKIIQEESVKPKEKVKEDVKVEVKKNLTIKDISKIADEELLPVIKKEVKKLTPTLLDEFVDDEFKLKIKEVVQKMFDTALEKFRIETKSLSKVQYEHLNVPISYFNIDLLNRLQKEGWCFKEMLRGDLVKICGLKGESVIFTRVKSNEWPKAPTLKELKGDSNENTK